ncbi:MAG TPA: hypothetical protein VI112_01205 [Bacteroidia bacterium]|jgi:hypothetical protein
MSISKRYLALLFLVPVVPSCAQGPVPADSFSGTYNTYSVQTWEERYEDNGSVVWENLVRPDTLVFWQLYIDPDLTFEEREYGREAGGFYAFNHYGKAFIRNGNWTIRNDTITLYYNEEKVYDNYEWKDLIETIDLVKAYGKDNLLRMRRWKFCGKGALTWKQDYNQYYIQREQ